MPFTSNIQTSRSCRISLESSSFICLVSHKKSLRSEMLISVSIPVILLPQRFALPISWKSHSRNIYIAVLTKKFLQS